MFSIIIPTFNNLKYLKKCVESLKKNSTYNHQIIIHINEGKDGTLEYAKTQGLDFTFTEYNAGICEGMNSASKKSRFDYILYAHDDFYFAPDWDLVMKKEIEIIGHNKFYLSGVMMNNGPIKCDFGSDLENFDEEAFLRNYKKFNHYDFQGSTWAPHLIHKDLWNKVGGFSEEFFPGTGSDPDLNMKLWKHGVRIFKGLNNCKVYHFGSIVTRKYKNNPKIITESGSRGSKIFLLKWGISISFFKKYILKSDRRYEGELLSPKRSIDYLFRLLICKLNYIYVKYFYNINKKKLK